METNTMLTFSKFCTNLEYTKFIYILLLLLYIISIISTKITLRNDQKDKKKINVNGECVCITN